MGGFRRIHRDNFHKCFDLVFQKMNESIKEKLDDVKPLDKCDCNIRPAGPSQIKKDANGRLLPYCESVKPLDKDRNGLV